MSHIMPFLALTALLSILPSTFTSFLAVGPPAAPSLASRGSAGGFLKESLDIKSPKINYATNYSSAATQSEYFWLADSTWNHKMPYANDGYNVFRNVKSYGAVGDGITDDHPAIQRAIVDGNRCGANCGATSTKGALIYFPPGTYAISQPIVQYYFTSFIGEPKNRAIIKPLPSFDGIALIDTNFYVENGDGANWWVSQNNFYRQIRNLVLDMRDMKPQMGKGPTIKGQRNLPVGIHWQVSQSCTLQNIEFLMSEAADTRHVGIFQENGSGGFVSNLSFVGGRFCWAAGSQQYTGRNIKFKNCKTAIVMTWDWGWNWKNIDVQGSDVAIDVTDISPSPDPNTQRYQGTGSITIMDSIFWNVGEVIRINTADKLRPAITIDNIRCFMSPRVVQEWGGETLLNSEAGANIAQWSLGWQFTDNMKTGSMVYGANSQLPTKPKSLAPDGLGYFFEREKPQYDGYAKSEFLSVLDFGVRNDGTSGDINTGAINAALQAASAQNKTLVFPAGIYLVDDTINIPARCRMVGVLWSQIMATGPAFSDPSKPKVLARIGNEGEKGVVEISDLMFTTRGGTAGAVLMEWNVHEESTGSAAMFDTIFRVGGAMGTDLTAQNCHWSRAYVPNDGCMATSLMLHVTTQASIYMENMWFWVADHDIEDNQQTKINIYAGRGVLIESKGPSWVYSSSNEHSTLYNWQLSGAENIYLGQIQSETPYFQAGQLDATLPYGTGIFAHDPSFDFCTTLEGGTKPNIDTCRESWALRIMNSSQVYLYGGGFYSFFNNYRDSCSKTANFCQDRLVDISFSEDIWLYNVYTVGAKEVISPQGSIYQSAEATTLFNGFATAISSWLLLAGPGKAGIGGSRDQGNGPFVTNPAAISINQSQNPV